MAKKEIDKNFLIKAGVYAIGGYLIYQAAKSFFKPSDDEQKEANPFDIDCNELFTNPKYNKNLTRNRGAYSADADQIFTAIQGTGLFVSWTEDDSKIMEVLKRAQTNADVAALICAFGLRAPSILSPAEPLNSYITSYLDNAYRLSVNADYRNKNISFQW